MPSRAEEQRAGEQCDADFGDEADADAEPEVVALGSAELAWSWIWGRRRGGVKDLRAAVAVVWGCSVPLFVEACLGDDEDGEED